MYSMVLMAALTTGTDMPDLGRRGGCRGCYGGMAWGGCYGGYGGCYGGGWGGCYGGGWGGCYGGYAMGWGGWGGGYGRGYVLGGASPWMGGYAYAPMMSGYGTPLVLGNTPLANVGMTQSFFFNPINATRANEATIVVHLPAEATLTIDGQPTQSTSSTRTFISPPLEPGKTYSYTLRAEMNRDGRAQSVKKTIDVRPGQPTEVTLDFRDADREENQINARPPAEQSTAPRRTPPPDR